MENVIYISNEQNDEEITKETENLCIQAINTALEYEEFEYKAEVSLTFVSEDEIKELNSKHRNKNTVTDVLSFPMLDGDFDECDEDISCEAVMLGDIVICTKRAKEQSVDYGHSFEREIAFLCVHSVLHLLGYDHETSEEDEKEMFGEQEKILLQIGQKR